MEVVHAIVGIVRSSPFTAFLQVSSRLLVVWLVFVPCEDVQNSPVSTLAILSWCFVEVPRYLFYALNIMDASPFLLTWIRYSLFFILYPTGISGEVLSMWKSLSFFENNPDYSVVLPNKWNVSVSVYATLLIFLVVYVWGSPTMYGHMMKQRSKALKKLKEN